MKEKKSTPEVNTSALPDIIFMLLFFFMTITVIRLNDEKIPLRLPKVKSLQKLEYNKNYGNLYLGSTPDLIQFNDKFVDINEVTAAINQLNGLARDGKYRTKLFVDQSAKMKMVNKMKLEIRKSDALKIEYVLEKEE